MAKGICSVEGCGRPHFGRGWCNRHYRRWYDHGDPLYKRPSVLERFVAKVAAPAPNGCEEWTGSRDPDGYGYFSPHKTLTVKAHRFAWELAHAEPIPVGIMVCHTCDNPPCVSSDHLFLGTAKDNTNDAITKGRLIPFNISLEQHPRGVGHGRAKLSEHDVRAIRALYASGDVTQRELAKRYGMAKSTIGNILRRKLWTHIP